MITKHTSGGDIRQSSKGKEKVKTKKSNASANSISDLLKIDLPLYQLKQVLAVVPIAAYVTNAAGRIVFYNEAAVGLWGRAPKLNHEKWCGSLQLFRADGRAIPHLKSPFATAIRKKKATTGEVTKMLRPDGTHILFKSYSTVFVDKKGCITRAMNLMIDVSDEPNDVEQARMKKSQDHIQAINPFGNWEMTGKNRESYWSEGFYNLHDLVPGSVKPSSSLRLSMVHPDDREDLRAATNTTLNTGAPFLLEGRILLSDERVRWILWKGESIVDKFTGKRKFFGTMLDITARKELEQKQKDTSQALSDFKNAISDASIVSWANKKGDITYVNENFVKISGFTREELVGKNHRIINSGFHPKSFWVDFWKKISAGESWRGEVRNKAKDGSYYWVDTFVMPFLNNKRKVIEYLSIRNDITKRKESEEALIKAEDDLRAVLNATNDPTFFINTSRKVRVANNAAILSLQRFFGTTYILGVDFEMLLPDFARPIFNEFYLKALHGERGDYERYLRDLKTHEEFWFNIRYMPVRDKHRQIIGVSVNLIDFTEKKRASVALMESDQLLGRLSANVPGMIYSFYKGDTQNGSFEYVSEGSFDLFNITSEQLIHDSNLFFNLIHPEDRPRVQLSIQSAISSRTHWAFEFRLEIPGIGEKWIAAASKPYLEADGRNVWYGFMQDITKIKRAEQRIVNLTNTIPNGFIYEYWLNAEGNEHQINYVSQGCETLFESTCAEALEDAEVLFRKIHTDDKQRFWETVQKQITNGGRFEIDYRIVLDNNRIKWINGRASVRKLADRSTIIEGLALDITQTKMLEEEELRLALIASKTSNAVILTDAEERITWVNDAFERITEFKKDEVIGKTPGSFLQGPRTDLNTTAKMREAIEHGEGFKVEVLNYSKSGRPIWLDIEVLPMRDQGGKLTGFMAIESDITERLKGRDELLAALKEKDILIKEIHHRVKNNLQLISSLLFLKKATINDDEVKSFLEETRQKIKSIALIHERLLQTGSVNFVDIADYLSNLLGDLQRSNLIPGLKIHFISKFEPLQMNLDTAIYCALIINELVTNSIKHAFANRTKGIIDIRLFKDEMGLHHLTVGDNGVSLSESVTIGRSNSFGMQMLEIFIKQLEAHVNIHRNEGTKFEIVFK